ncbi:MAG: HK97 family phage prohead protease, partial [Pseudomonadota bacterium]
MATEAQRRRWAKRRHGKREASNELHRRHFAIRAEDVREDGSFRLVAATDRACDVGPYDERLLCGAENVDHSAAHSLLLNHKSASLVGGIKSIQANGSDVTAEVTVDPDAKMETGVRVIDAVKRGYLRGVSIGYTYKWSDAKREGDQRVTVTVNKWSLREVTLTPIPADTAASVRALPGAESAGAGERAQKTTGDTEMKWREFLIALLRAAGQKVELADVAEKDGVDSVEKAQAWFDKRQADVKKPEPDNEVEKERAARIEAERRQELAEREAKIRRLADAFDVNVEGLDYAKTEKELTEELVKRHGEAKKSRLAGNVSVEVTRDVADKASEAAVDGVLAIGGIRE